MAKILVDFHQTVIAAVAAQAKEFKGESPENVRNMVKHVAFGMLLKFKQKFKGELIICTDSNFYWRVGKLPSYKGHRKHDKKKDELLDWDLIHSIIEEIKEDIRENFNFKIIEVKGAEADDVIAILCKYYQENECKGGVSFEPVPEDIVIVSTDGDLPQLQKYRNVRQWNNVAQKFIVAENPHHVLIEHICTGDSGDNVPNILTGDEWAHIRARGEKPPKQKSFMKTRLPEFYEKGIDACLNDEERRNYERNEWLVSLDKIPSLINNRVIEAYHNFEKRGSLGKMSNYFIKHRMKVLHENIQNFR